MTPSLKRKDFFPYELLNLNDEPKFDVERNEIVKLTKVAKSWDFTCSFCFKKFPSAQAMGGHQNAHRNERLEEKRLYIRDPIGYRKRAFLKAMKDNSSSRSGCGGHGPLQTLSKTIGVVGEFNAPSSSTTQLSYKLYGEGSRNMYGTGRNVRPFATLNLFPHKELRMSAAAVARDGVNSEDGKGKAKAAAVDACMADEVIGNVSEMDELDLSLKL